MHSRVYYEWKECHDQGNGVRHFVTPWSDPMVYEHPFDFMFDTIEDACNAIVEYDIDVDDEGWVLCRTHIREIEFDKSLLVLEDVPDEE